MNETELERWQRDLERREQALNERIDRLDKQYAEALAQMEVEHEASVRHAISVLDRYHADVQKVLGETVKAWEALETKRGERATPRQDQQAS